MGGRLWRFLLYALPCALVAQTLLFALGAPGSGVDNVRQVFAQSSAVSLLETPTATPSTVIEAATVARPASTQGSQTSLVLVALVLGGVFTVVGLVVWRQQ
jgi:hypothetical protein